MDIKQNIGIHITESVTVTDPTNNRSIAIKAAYADPEKGPKMREAIANNNKSRKGIPKSEITKQRMREAKLGKKKSPEHLVNLRKSRYMTGCIVSIGNSFIMGSGATEDMTARQKAVFRDQQLQMWQMEVPGLSVDMTYHEMYFKLGVWLYKKNPYLFHVYGTKHLEKGTSPVTIEDVKAHVEKLYAK